MRVADMVANMKALVEIQGALHVLEKHGLISANGSTARTKSAKTSTRTRRTRRTRKPRRRPRQKLTTEQTQAIQKDILEDKLTRKQIAEKHGVHVSRVQRMVAKLGVQKWRPAERKASRDIS